MAAGIHEDTEEEEGGDKREVDVTGTEVDESCYNFFLAVVQKSGLQLSWKPKQCSGPFFRSLFSEASALVLSLSLLRDLMADLAADTSLFLISLVRPPLPL